MNVESINRALLDGNLPQVMDLLRSSRDQKISSRAVLGAAAGANIHFKYDWALSNLPMEPGLISVRGPRQYGKSTWLNSKVIEAVEQFGPGSAGYLNGDLIADKNELREQVRTLALSLSSKATVKRIFIDEISAIDEWSSGLKPLLDSGLMADILIVATGSKASDIRRGMERLPGRKGRLSRSSYIFFPLSFSSFCEQAKRVTDLAESDYVDTYLLSGGSPLAAAELLTSGRLPEFVLETTRDWVYGEIARSGRSRAYLISVLQAIRERGGQPIGFTKLAREAGLANNTAASDYIDQLSDLFVIGPGFAWDSARNRPIFRRPCKMHFVNLLAALAWLPNAPRTVKELRSLPEQQRGALYEWFAAQELFRRNTFLNEEFPEQTYYWLSERQEVDFVVNPSMLLEVKSGKSSPLDFCWFSDVFPKAHLVVVSESKFEARGVVGRPWGEWLLSPSDVGSI